MSWGGGTDIACDMIDSLILNVQCRDTRRRIYKDLLKTLEMSDWGDPCESFGIDPIWEGVVWDAHPEWFDD